MPWFPVGKDDAGAWRLDIVALLAVTGEGFIHEHAQSITSSALCIVPRIMPAPQALMRPWRPVSLPSERAQLVGVHNGVILESLGFFANMIHPLDALIPFEFRIIGVRHRQLPSHDSELRSGGRKLPPPSTQANDEVRDKYEPEAPSGRALGPDVERRGQQGTSGLKRRSTFREHVADLVSNAPTLHGDTPEQPWTRFRTKLSPLHMVGVLSFLLTIALIGAAAYWKDGTAMIAIILVSFATSTIGYAAWWRPRLTSMARPVLAPGPLGDLVIRTRVGSFLLIRCTEQVARELYTGAEECEYVVSGRRYRVLMVLGAVLMMPAVILLGNCTFNMQALVGAAYMILNIVYWGLGLLPKRFNWDLSRYVWEDLTPDDAKLAHQNRNTDIDYSPDSLRSFTRTLWYAIRETEVTGWVERSGAVPSTPQWSQWLREAREAAASGNRTWQAVTRKDEIMNESPHNFD